MGLNPRADPTVTWQGRPRGGVRVPRALPPLALAVLLLGVAPRAPAAGTNQPAELVVLAASSLQHPLEAVSRAFEARHPGVKVQLSLAATGVLLNEIADGAPADVFVGASADLVGRLPAEAVAGPPLVIARNSLVVAIPWDSRLHVQTLADLAQPSIHRIAIGRKGTVPAGDYAREALAKEGLVAKLSDRFIEAESVAQVLRYIESGDVDAGFVYASDLVSPASASGPVHARLALEISDSLHQPITYPAVILRRGAQPALAHVWVDFLTSANGQAILSHEGLRPR